MDDNAWEGPLQEFRHAELRASTCIRLVQIQAELFRGDISCTLQQYETDTQTCPDYAALSYVWGDPTPTHTIYVNGLVYRVHRNLWEFLSHSRTAEDTERPWYWTDLLCINQAHHSEKNDQISRMGDIYAQAAHVISWLGTQVRTVEALRVIFELSEADMRSASKYDWNPYKTRQIHDACLQLGYCQPYWNRVWITQEVACARDCIVACGNYSLSLEDLLHKMETVMDIAIIYYGDTSGRKDGMTKHIKMKALADLKNSVQQGKTMNFVGLLEKTGSCRATKDRDKIYGLLGLASRLDPGFDPCVLGVSRHKSLNDVWWDMIFMILDGQSISSIKSDLAALQNHFLTLAPPRKHWIIEMRSNTRRSCAETALWAYEVAYSKSIQELLGLCGTEAARNSPFAPMWPIQLVEGWERVTTHVLDHENDVPGLQTRLGWSLYAGLRFPSLKHISDQFPKKLEGSPSLPLGWLCAAHWSDPLERTTAKHHILSRELWVSPEDRHVPAYCSGAEYGGPRCDLSLVLLRIEPLGVTCIVRLTGATQFDFYCNCCHADDFELPYNIRRF